MRKKTAVITGASSGIGMEFAKRYAKRGYQLVLTARRTDRLEALAQEVKVPCEIISADLNNETECHCFFDAIKDRSVDVFINNAGFGTCGNFDETDLSKEVSMIHVNVRAMHILCKKMLQKMKKQKYGKILNVASSAGLLPAGPHMATYYATKAYVVSLTKGIAQELKEQHSPVYVGALCPGPVDTEFNERADVKFALKGISPERCVKEALKGMKRKQVMIVPSLLMRLSTLGQRFTPEPMLLRLISIQQKKKTGKNSSLHSEKRVV